MAADISHPHIRQPERDTITVWRYLKHDKFISLLTKRAHYFASLTQLQDGHEGSLPEADWLWLQKNAADPEQFTRLRKTVLSSARVCCWTISEHESDAMWKIYAPGDESIAIRSTYARLRDSANPIPPYSTTIGLVEYKDFKSAPWSGTVNQFAPLYWKRKAFEYEQ